MSQMLVVFIEESISFFSFSILFLDLVRDQLSKDTCLIWLYPHMSLAHCTQKRI